MVWKKCPSTPQIWALGWYFIIHAYENMYLRLYNLSASLTSFACGDFLGAVSTCSLLRSSLGKLLSSVTSRTTLQFKNSLLYLLPYWIDKQPSEPINTPTPRLLCRILLQSLRMSFLCLRRCRVARQLAVLLGRLHHLKWIGEHWE